MRRFTAIASASLAFAAVASADAPSARNVYVERRGLMEVDARCHLFGPEVHAALQVTTLQARGTLLRGGWSLAQMNQLEQLTVQAAQARACNDPRTTSAAATARAAYNTTFRSNAMEFPGWARSWSARRIPSDGWRLRQSIGAPVAATIGVRQFNGAEQFVLVMPVANEGDAPGAIRLELRNLALPAGPLDLTTRIAGGLGAAAPGPANAISVDVSTRLVEHPAWFQTQVAYVIPSAVFRMLCQLDPRESIVIHVDGPRGAQQIYVEVGDVAAAASFLATRAD